MASVNALKQLMIDYQDVRATLAGRMVPARGRAGAQSGLRVDGRTSAGRGGCARSWFEMKVLRQYQTIYAEALHRMRDISYVVAINTRLLAEDAARRDDVQLLHLTYEVLQHVRARGDQRATTCAPRTTCSTSIACSAQIVARLPKGGAYAVEIARYFKYYGLISYAANLPFILETVAYDLCALNELAFERERRCVDELLRILLRVDKESEGAVQEQSLRGVRKAQIKLATFFLMRGDEARARQVYIDMANEDLVAPGVDPRRAVWRARRRSTGKSSIAAPTSTTCRTSAKRSSRSSFAGFRTCRRARCSRVTIPRRRVGEVVATRWMVATPSRRGCWACAPDLDRVALRSFAVGEICAHMCGLRRAARSEHARALCNASKNETRARGDRSDCQRAPLPL